MKRNPIIKRYVSKLRKRLRNRRYKKKNPDKFKEWYEKNREKKLDYSKEYKKNNKEKIKITTRKWKLKNPDKETKYNWKRYGLIGNFDEIYKRYEETTNCDLCNIFLEGNGSAMKCMDHSHKTGLFRNILCNSCNVKRGEDNF